MFLNVVTTADPIAGIFSLAIRLYIYVVIARVVISWLNLDQNNRFVEFVFKITDPPLDAIRKHVPLFSGIDISPAVLILGLLLIQKIIYYP